jgi:O-antigen/teichoic acid export membrane protein
MEFDLLTNLAYMFGSWAYITCCYFIGYSVTRTEKRPDGRGSRIVVMFSSFVAALFIVVLFSVSSGLPVRQFFSNSLLLMLLVTSISLLFGVFRGVRRNHEEVDDHQTEV